MKQHYIDEKTGISYTLQGDFYSLKREKGILVYGNSGTQGT